MRKLYFILSFLLVVCSLNAQLYGTTSVGGKGGGTISVLDPVTTSLKTQFNFDTQEGEYAWYSRLIQATNGKLYGMTYLGGGGQNGIIFSYNPTTAAYTKLYDFDYYNGGQPFGSLMQASDGKLYGMTNNGGSNGRGVIFCFSPVDNSYTKLFDFNTTNGESPYGSLIQASDGKLYGTAASGGAHSDGVIFCYDITTSVYTKLEDFDGSNGKAPLGDFIQEPDGKLYAMTANGGNNNRGTIFSYDPTDSSLTKLKNFDKTNGSNPYGSFVKSPGGNFYAMTRNGGTSDAGVIFSFNPGTNTYEKLKDFDDYANGAHPHGSLTLTADGQLYGMTFDGGTYSRGVLFSYNIASTAYTKLKDFDGTDGANPYGSLLQTADGKLYGMTFNGGNGEKGVIFSYDPLSNVFIKFKNFGINGTGSIVYGGVVKGASGLLYGMAYRGGKHALGTFFSFNPSTSTYAKLLDFDNTTGNSPFGSLMLATDGKLYGMTLSGGGVKSAGVIFSFDPLTSTYSKVKEFDEANGATPYGNLLQATNGLLYGMTNGGGANGSGVLFSFNPVTLAYTKFLDFNGTNGAYPTGSLMQAKDGKLYGVTYNGGPNEWGVLFSFNPGDSTYTKIMEFDVSTGLNPSGTLVQAVDNKLYGVTSAGNVGGIFSYDPSTKVFAKVKDFNGADGAYPKGSLMNGSDGKLYGMTMAGGAYGYGVCFSIDPLTSTYTKIQDFRGVNGKTPEYTFFTELNSILPLNLLSFTAARNGNSSLLRWTTAQEINTSHFEIQRSNNSMTFVNIGIVRSLSNGKAQNDYTFTDAQPLTAINYYRLKMVDKDGSFTYSDVKSVKYTGVFDMAIYPNPIHQVLRLGFNTAKAMNVQINVVNAAGKTVYTRKLQLPYGESIQNINIAALSNGSYFLKCITTEEQRVLKLIKQ